VLQSVVSIGMSIVLECRNLHKRFVVGAGSCRASAHVLRGVDLAVRAGECVAVVAPRGEGKSTLLLCAAGLLRPNAGEVRWFGHLAPSRAAHRIAYHWTTANFSRRVDDDASIHLLDVAVPREAGVERWIETRRERGDAILFAARDESASRALASRVVYLRNGILRPAARADAASRVAEPVA
jgi:ABC-type uncharacterized transport system ATPase subunit